MNPYELKTSYSSSKEYKFVEISIDGLTDGQKVSETIARITAKFLTGYKCKVYNNGIGDNSIIIQKKRNLFSRQKWIISTDIPNRPDINTISLTLNPCNDQSEMDLSILVEKLIEE